MKISCQSCQAKYTIADEKVLGKIVKIRCKKCSATIVINGNEAAEPPEDATHVANNVFDYTAGSTETWTVNVADGDQRTLTAQDIVREYRAGVVNDETYCWKDGMADWLPLREIEQIYRLVADGPRPTLQPDNDSTLAYQPPSGGHAAGGLFDPPPDHHANGNGANGGMYNEPMAAAGAQAARRVGRGGGGTDLFSGAARAGGEEDVVSSAHGAHGAGAPAAGDEKLTGQRNESSVLFSLSALTKETSAPKQENRTTAQSDGSGLIDIRALSASMGAMDQQSSSKNHVDDIMNLSGGGAFGAALGAPILAPPPVEATAPAHAAESGGGKGLAIGLLGGFGLLAAAIVVVAVLVLKQKPAVDPNLGSTASTGASATTSATAGATGTSATPSATVAAADTASGVVAKPPGSDTATGPKVPTGAGTTVAAVKPTATATVAANTTPTTPAATATAAPPPQPTATSLAAAMATAAGTTAPPPPAAAGGGTAPFDRGAAAAALGGVNVQGCKKPDGPTGGGHVKVTFNPDGTVQSANVDQAPYQGTPVGACIAGKFRGIHIPPFAGGAVGVGKSFTIN